MAKRRSKKEENKKQFQYKKEIEGLLIILFSIAGLCSFGIVGEAVKRITIFLCGSWYFIVLLLILCLGIYLIAKRNQPNYFSARLIGIYTLIIALLLFAHLNIITTSSIEKSSIIPKTYERVAEAFKSSTEIRETDGGITGAIISWAFVSLFDVEGTWIVLVVISAFGFIMLFDITLVHLLLMLVSPFKKLFTRNKEDNDSSEVESKDEEIDNRVIITSVEDLNNSKTEVVGNMSEKEAHNIHVEHGTYVKPPVTLLDLNKNKGKVNSTEFIASNTKTLERVFQDFGMKAQVIEVHVGPAVTQYEMDVERGTKVNKVLSISREIALALAAKEVRIEAPIPGKNTVGVEIPNQQIIPVSMREVIEEIPRKFDDSKLLAPLGRDIMGKIRFVEINKTPHMLVAGATGSGKSVCINNIIISVLMRTTPEEVKMVLVDPKKVEFNVYENIPHLLTPVVTDPKKASAALQKIVNEMDERYETFKNSETKNITSYNEYVEKEHKKNPSSSLEKMPYILVVIDELADLMLVAAKEVEESIMRITQLARAAGIHLIVATQRPSADIITGLIKANIPTRISFAVSSSIDSRTILDMMGAEKLLGKGDMLYKPMDENTPIRIQGSFVSDDEIKRVVDFVKKRTYAPTYDEKFMNLEEQKSSNVSAGEPKDKDVLYDDILSYAISTGQISASLIQRKYSIGYNRAARIIDIFEEKGIVGPAKGSKPRDVLVKFNNQND